MVYLYLGATDLPRGGVCPQTRVTTVPLIIFRLIADARRQAAPRGSEAQPESLMAWCYEALGQLGQNEPALE